MKAWLCSCLKTLSNEIHTPPFQGNVSNPSRTHLDADGGARTGAAICDSKLDALLAARVREGDSGTQRVIIRTTSNGIPGLTSALEGLVIRCFAVIRASMR